MIFGGVDGDAKISLRCQNDIDNFNACSIIDKTIPGANIK
jgi:hypothetical protein